jgi:glycosyltransferase involved in cell wall biosynthesis
VGADDAEAIAAHLDRLAADRGEAERMGQAARGDAERHTWPRAVEVLVRPLV